MGQFSILSSIPPENEPPIPVQKALILDPWLEPLPSLGPLPHLRLGKKRLPSILVINSETFTLWKGHFERLMEVGRSWTDSEGQWQLLTIGEWFSPQTTVEYLMNDQSSFRTRLFLRFPDIAIHI